MMEETQMNPRPFTDNIAIVGADIICIIFTPCWFGTSSMACGMNFQLSPAMARLTLASTITKMKQIHSTFAQLQQSFLIPMVTQVTLKGRYIIIAIMCVENSNVLPAPTKSPSLSQFI